MIDIENASHYQYPADRAFQFLFDKIEQSDSVGAKDESESETPRVTEPIRLLHNTWQIERFHEKGDTGEGVPKGDSEGDRPLSANVED